MDQHILVPFDRSPLAERMLAHVQALAKSLGAEVVLLRVAFTHILPGADGIQAQVARCRGPQTMSRAWPAGCRQRGCGRR
jgi:hypothetical protein